MPEKFDWKKSAFTAVVTAAITSGTNLYFMEREFSKKLENWVLQQEQQLKWSNAHQKRTDVKLLNEAFQNFRVSHTTDRNAEVMHTFHVVLKAKQPEHIFGDAGSERHASKIVEFEAVLQRLTGLNFLLMGQGGRESAEFASARAHIHSSHGPDARKIVQEYNEFHNSYGQRVFDIKHEVEGIVETAIVELKQMETILSDVLHHDPIVEYIQLRELNSKFSSTLAQLNELYALED